MNECKCTEVYGIVDYSINKTTKKLLDIRNFIFNEFILGGHLAALSVSAIAFSIVMLSGFIIKWEFLLIVYLSTLCIYGYDRYKEITVDYSIDKTTEKLLGIRNFIFNEFIHGGHLCSLGVSAVVLSVMLLLGIMIRWEFLVIVYLLVLCVYSYDHYKELKVDALNNSYRTNHLRKYCKLFPFILTLYGTVVLVLLFYFGDIESLIFGGTLLLTGILYTKKFKKLTKKIIGFKNYYTSFSISSIIFFTTIYYNSHIMSMAVLILFIFLFLRLIINTSFCDIKDVNADKKDHLLTLPIVFGRERFLVLLHILNLFSVVPLIIGVYMKLLPSFSLLLLTSIFYSSYYLYKGRKRTTDIQSISSTLVDGEFILWPFLLFIGKIFVMTI